MPQFSLADTLNTITPYLPRALVTLPVLAHVRDAARPLPAALTNRIYLETRLHAEDPSVDLSFDTSATGYEILAGRNPAIPFPETVSGCTAWTRLQNLYRAFAGQSAVLGRYGSQILLEFDIETGRTPVPTPGVFVGLTQGGCQEPEARDQRRKPQLFTRFVREVLACLHEKSLPRSVRNQLHACCAALPPRAELSYVGFMPARPHRAIRLCITGLSIDSALEYLNRIGRPSTDQGLRDVLSGFATAAPMLHVDVWDTVRPRLGMEFFLARRPQRTGRLIEHDWLDRLVRTQLCAPEKRDALLAWPGSTALQFPHVFWPTVLRRRVNHVKLVWTPRTVTAKAYLFAVIDARVL